MRSDAAQPEDRTTQLKRSTRAANKVRAQPHGITQSKSATDSLNTTARTTQPLEPILIPKLRIQFADFPYLHYSSN